MISFERFLEWAESRFPGDVIARGNEVKINSPFSRTDKGEDDYKHHLWCNPFGGKKSEDRPFGVYHCWKTNRKGTLVSLVMQIDHCPFEEAVETLEGGVPLRVLEDDIDKMFDAPQAELIFEAPAEGIPLPAHTYRISELDERDPYRCMAEVYLAGRGIPVGHMMICKDQDSENEYRERLIIPYYDRQHRLIYWNGRYIGEDKNALRYLGPPKSIGVGKDDVIYVPQGRWPVVGEKMHITEGELCSESLALVDFNPGAFGGKNLSEKQAVMLRGNSLCLCLDNDNSGREALDKVAGYFISHGFADLTYVRPPTIYKDWNEMLKKAGKNLLRQYILKFEKPYDFWTGLDRGLNLV